ncbi:type II toxin-antitoxin system HicB family antitoxin [Peribacillus deserti]|nr:type II toxin-antitoxin system HicB family antitoxin [Peribacillus deserti]
MENCFTDGRTFEEAVEMAQDVLGTMLSFAEDQEEQIPIPSRQI